MEHAAPDNLENLLPLCGEPETDQIDDRKTAMPLWSSMQTLYGGMPLGAGFRSSSSLVILDVNPSLYLEVDGDETVTKAEALNDDAVPLLEGLGLCGTALGEALDALIEAMFNAGYLSDIQNSILVSVENNDAEKENELREKVSGIIESVMRENLGNSEDAASVITQSVDEDDEELAVLAGEYGISMGKAEYIRKLIADSKNEAGSENGNNTIQGSDNDASDISDDSITDEEDSAEPLTFEDLVPMTVNDIALVAESRNIKDNTVTMTGHASDRGFIGLARALDAAMAYAGVEGPMVGRKKASLDCRRGVMVYEVKLKTAVGTFKYALDARTGAMVECRKGGVRGEYTPSAPQTGTLSAEAGSSRSPYIAGLQSVPESRGTAEVASDITPERNNDMNDNTDFNRAAPAYIMPEGAISEQAAKEAALSHAGLRESDCLYVYCHPEEDHGNVEHYDVKFAAGPYKYKYAIGIFDGAVLGRAVKDKRNKSGYVYEGNYHEHYAYPLGDNSVSAAGYDTVPGPAAQIKSSDGQTAPVRQEPVSAPNGGSVQSGTMITEDQALDIALKNAGLTRQSLEKWKIKIRTKYGRTVYRVKLKIRGFEYEYDVDAYTGVVTKAEKEIDY